MSETDANTIPATQTDPATPPANPPAPAAPPAPPADPASDVEKWKALSRQNEKAKNDALGRVTLLEAEVGQLRTASTQAETVTSTANAEIAKARFEAAAARAGVPDETVAGLLEVIDPARLMKDGQADSDAIKSVVEPLAKSGKKPGVQPDPDLGKRDKGGSKPPMNTLFRAARP